MGAMNVCLKCGGTGVLVDGSRCDCQSADEIRLPVCLEVPVQYQNVKFDKSFLRSELQGSYGSYMEELIRQCTDNLSSFNKNILICAPPNSGKTVFAYTVYGMLYAKGRYIPKLMDIMEVRRIILDYYGDPSEIEKFCRAKLAIIKLPMDLPNRFPETMSTIVERRVRANCSTIFLYGGSKEDILAQDRFGKLKHILGDGSYNSIEVKSW